MHFMIFVVVADETPRDLLAKELWYVPLRALISLNFGVDDPCAVRLVRQK